MSIRSVYREGRSASRLAWGLLPPAIIIGALLLLRQPGSSETARVTVVQSWDDAEMLAVNPIEERLDSSQDFIPPAAERRNQALQRLGQFRADYKQLAPSMKVSFRTGSSERAQIAATIERALSQYGLGYRSAEPVSDVAVQNRQAAVIVSAPRSHRETVYRLLEALAPLFSARVLLIFDDEIRIDALTLHIEETPTFSKDGLAVFQH